MVPGRKPAALGLRALLAQRRQADLARPRSLIARETKVEVATGGASTEAAERFADERRASGSASSRISSAGLRGSVALDHRGRRASGQCRSARSEDSTIRKSAPHGAHVRARPDASRRLRAAGAALERRSRARWLSEKWQLRRGKLFLVPGDSPVGFRLPLSSLPYVPPRSYPYVIAAGPVRRAQSAARTRRPAAQRKRASVRARREAGRQDIVEQDAVEGAVRTALSVEPRDGRLCVFMPPVKRLEDYLDLLARDRGGSRARLDAAGSHRRLCAAARPAHSTSSR